MKKLLLSAFTILIGISSNAQNAHQPEPTYVYPPVIYKGKRTCGTEMPSREWNEAFNKEVEKFTERIAAGRTVAANITIPVIVHVIHTGQNVGVFPNLTQAQVNSQISVLNNDFAGTGFNSGNLASTAFSAVGAANTGITFCLATQDTDAVALAEPGIHRVNATTMGWASPTSFNSTSSFQNYINTVVKPATIWDPYSFLNLWVTDEDINNVGLLGYATFPAGTFLAGIPGTGMGTPTTDGVWCWAAAFGNTGTLTPGYNLGRTASHEIGHYLGLRHIGGDGQANGTGPGNVNGDCTATDYCADTPPQKGGNAGGQYGQNYGGPGYPLHTASCGTLASPNGNPNGDMFMNFMDYVDDAYCYMFTPNQGTRMQTALTQGSYRTGFSISSATQCAAAPAANISMTNSACANDNIVVTNSTTAAPTPNYTWTSNPAGAVFSPANTSSNPAISFTSAGTYTINCSMSNASGSDSYSTVVTINGCVGLKDYTKFGGFISLQPNPSNGRVNIVTTLPYQQSLDVVIMNSLGQIISSASHKNISASVIPVDLSQQPSGVYFVSISNGQERVVKRVVLNK